MEKRLKLTFEAPVFATPRGQDVCGYNIHVLVEEFSDDQSVVKSMRITVKAVMSGSKIIQWKLKRPERPEEVPNQVSNVLARITRRGITDRASTDSLRDQEVIELNVFSDWTEELLGDPDTPQMRTVIFLGKWPLGAGSSAQR